MRGTLTPALVACLGALLFAAPKPASAMPAGGALDYGQTNAGVVQEVGDRNYKGGNYKGRNYSKNWNKRYKIRSTLCLASARTSSFRGLRLCKVERDNKGRSARVG